MATLAKSFLVLLALFAIVSCYGHRQLELKESDKFNPEFAVQGIGSYSSDHAQIQVRQHVDDLSQSGPDTKKLLRHVASLTEEWDAIAKRLGVPVEIGDWQCFNAGCFVVSRHSRKVALTSTLAEFALSKAFLQWGAGKFQGAPQRSINGEIEITWILFSPQGDVFLALPDDLIDWFK